MAAGLFGALAAAADHGEYDETSAKPISTDFGRRTCKIAAKMVDSMLADDVIQEISSGPPLLVDKVKNKTTQHIDTESITDSIRTKTDPFPQVQLPGSHHGAAPESWPINRRLQEPIPAGQQDARAIC